MQKILQERIPFISSSFIFTIQTNILAQRAKATKIASHTSIIYICDPKKLLNVKKLQTAAITVMASKVSIQEIENPMTAKETHLDTGVFNVPGKGKGDNNNSPHQPSSYKNFNNSLSKECVSEETKIKLKKYNDNFDDKNTNQTKDEEAFERSFVERMCSAADCKIGDEECMTQESPSISGCTTTKAEKEIAASAISAFEEKTQLRKFPLEVSADDHLHDTVVHLAPINRYLDGKDNVNEHMALTLKEKGKPIEKEISTNNNTNSYTIEPYIAPEQALVTSVELVVPPLSLPAQSTGVFGDSSLVSKLQFSASAFNSSTPTENNKSDGCATDSNLNIKIPTNLNLSSATATCDILLPDRRSAIWTPHEELKQNQQEIANENAVLECSSHEEREPVLSQEHIESNTFSKQDRLQNTPVTFTCPEGSNIYRPIQAHRQPQHPELTLQIEKDTTEGFPQMMFNSNQSIQQQHQLLTHHQHHDQQQQMQSNMYAQMFQHQQHHHQPLHYPSYSHHHYPGDHIFGIHTQQHTEQSFNNESYASHPAAQLNRQVYDNQIQSRMQSLPQIQHHQVQDAYSELLMEEFHEEPNTAYKLTLSPNNAKPENQDDGYETSAGDVLTPNSHSSSTHSITPQLQIQHGSIGMAQTKHEDLLSQQSLSSNNALPSPKQVQLNTATDGQRPNTTSLNDRLSVKENMNSSEISSNNSYNFMESEIEIPSPTNRHTGTEALDTQSPYVSVSHPQESDEFFGPEQQQQHSLILETSVANPHQDNPQQISNISVSESFAKSTPSLSNEINAKIDETNLDLGVKPAPKRRGRKKKVVGSETGPITLPQPGCEDGVSDSMAMGTSTTSNLQKPKERKKHDRFNGMTEAEVIQRTIPDHLCENLDIVIVGINPGLFAAYKGHHYAGPGNHFWKCLYLSGLTQEQMSADEDHKLIKYGIGFTNMVARATKGSADLTRKEIKEGSRILLEKLQKFRPKIAVFNGKLIFEVFSGKKEFHFGRQPDRVEGTDTYIWVMPSSSARCAQLPRAADKVPFYAALKKFRDFINGKVATIDDAEFIFTEQRIRQCCGPEHSKSGKRSLEHVNKETLLFGEHTTINKIGDIEESCPGQAENLVQQYSGNSSVNVTNQRPFICGNNGNSRGDHNAVIAQDLIPEQDQRSERPINENYILSAFGQGLQSQIQHQPPLQPQEKKKRGRPKKLKGQEIFDSVTENKLSLGQKIPQSDLNNIINLSIVSTGGGGSEIPKKKRGRPKKMKPSVDLLTSAPLKHGIQSQQHQLSQQPQAQTQAIAQTNVMNVHMEHTSSPQSHQGALSLYNTPPPSHHHVLYPASASPMASPALNGTYARATPPMTLHGTPPIVDQQHSITDLGSNSKTNTNKSQSLGIGVDSHQVPSHSQTNLGETPPPSSPSLCAIDFDTSTAARNMDRSIRLDSEQVLPHGHEKPQYSSPAPSVEPTHSQEHYQQHWLSSVAGHQQNSQKTIQSSVSPNVPYTSHLHPSHHTRTSHSLHYQATAMPQEQQMAEQQWQNTLHTQQQRFDEQSLNAYFLSVPQPHQSNNPVPSVHQSQQIGNPQPQIVSDVTQKSLSGLESLVEQIPSMSEHESNSISSATAAAAAAAVECRLLGLQQQQKRCMSSQQDTAMLSERLGAATSEVAESTDATISTAMSQSHSHSNNFSVSNLAASSAVQSSSEGSPHHLSNSVSLSVNGHNEFASQCPTAYHPNLISAALVAASANSPQSSGAVPHPHPHSQMYMDPHIPPVNSMYGSAPGSHPHSHVISPVNSMFSASTGGSHHMPPVNSMYGAPHPHVHPHAHAAYGPAEVVHYSSAHHHYHHPSHSHAPHHLFERLKPSDISGYSGF